MTHAFRHEPRLTLTNKQRVKLFLDRGGRCEGPCKRKLGSGDVWHLDHRIALENGGSNDESNIQVLCKWCHKPKTAKDAAKAAKGRDVAVSVFLPSDQKKSKGRPLAGTRRSGWKHKMDGGWERR